MWSLEAMTTNKGAGLQRCSLVFMPGNCLSRSVTTFMSNDMPNCMHQTQINFRFYFIPYQMHDRKSNIDTKHYMSIG